MDPWEEAKYWAALDLRRAGFTRVCGKPKDTDTVSLQAYRELLETEPSERDVQRFLNDNPRMLTQEYGAQCRWIKPQQRLGAEYVPDFMVARCDSYPKIQWTLIELQRPDAALFTGAGRMTDQLDEAIQQILEWRRWITDNGDYARKPRTSRGLGLYLLGPEFDGLIIIGRRDAISDEDRERARDLTRPHFIKVHTYDWLVRSAAWAMELGSTGKECHECESIRHLTHPGRSKGSSPTRATK